MSEQPDPPCPPPAPSLLLIISGPAGSGMTTVCDTLLERLEGLSRVVTATTRPPREGEHEGVDYYFLSREEFLRKRKTGAFYESAAVHEADRFYGTLKSEVDDRLACGRDLLLNIDVQGAAAWRDAAHHNHDLAQRLVTIFIHPPSLQELEKRLAARGTDAPSEIQRRMETARGELRAWPTFDYCIISSDREADFERVKAIYLAEKVRVRS